MVRCRAQNAVWIALFAIIICFSVAQTALAGIAPTPCDAQYYNSLKSRAWLEAQREITQNQNLIFKPDSVLEYTCFDRYMSVLAGAVAGSAGGGVGGGIGGSEAMFSETTRWDSSADTNMADALESLVGGALTSYINANFSHDYLGGRMTGQNYTPSAVTKSSSYTCDTMATVWAEAKCMDFIQNPTNDTTDGFFTFENYSTTPDKRFLPTRCQNATLPAKWKDEINLATVDDFTPWTENNVLTYFDLLDPANCANSLKIPTGVIVVRSKLEPVQYYEKVCVAAGCHYVPNNSSPGPGSGSCQRAAPP